MAALSAIHPTLLDVSRRVAPNGTIDKIVEMLNQTNRVLDDMVWIEGNLPTGHKTTARTGLPSPTWRKFYGGVQPTKSTTVQVTATCGMLQAYAEVDKKLADLANNQEEFRLSEDMAHIEGMNEEFVQTLIYGNEGSEPEAFTGFMPAFNARSGVANAENVIHGGSADTDNTSILLVVWGANTVFGITPKGSPTGLQMTDKGQVTIENIDGLGGRAEGYRSHYEWDCGLCIRDWRYVVRICNIEVSALLKNPTSGADLIDLMTQALELPPSLTMGRPVFYCNRTIKSFLRRQINNKVTNSTLTMDKVAGNHVMMFDGIPVHRVDAITNTEALVPA